MFDIIEFISKILKKDKQDDTRSKAKERLKLVLVSDRASVSPQVMENLREELIQVISRYMTIDIDSMEMGLERKEGSVVLAANIPIVNIRRNQGKTARSSAALDKPEPSKPKPVSSVIKDEGIVEVPSSAAIVEELYSPSHDGEATVAAAVEPVREEPIKADADEKPAVHGEGCMCPDCYTQEEIHIRKKGRRIARKAQAQARGKSLRKRIEP